MATAQEEEEEVAHTWNIVESSAHEATVPVVVSSSPICDVPAESLGPSFRPSHILDCQSSPQGVGLDLLLELSLDAMLAGGDGKRLAKGLDLLTARTWL